jgi:two-component system, OmpR family, phosphate regulon sensor histidine kinase PhoR
MDRRVITALAVAITLALVGLVIVQAEWVRNTITLKDAQFGENVDRALMAVSENLERVEALQGIKEHEEGRWILEHMEEAPITDEEGIPPPPAPAEEWNEEAPTLNPGDIDPADAEATERESERQRLLSDVFRGILSAGRFRDIRERVEARVLDSLITDELRRRGITAEHQYGILDGQGHTMLSSVHTAADSTAVSNSPHRAQLFRGDMMGEAYWLHVNIPGQQRVVLERLWPMLAASALFVLLIGAAFVFTLRTIWKQKRLNEIRNDLVNNLTHELKTPISTIALACEALNDPGIPKSAEQVKVFTGMIRDENKRLGMLVESVLQSAVVDSGSMRLRVVDVDMHALLADVVRTSTIQAENRGGRIVVDARAELAHVKGDRIHLTNVFYNLIDNALKYCEREPLVTILTASDAKGITIRVSDNGIGIARSDHRKVFERLYRVPTGNLHNVKGFGLGLSYVRSVVERHGGTIGLESEPGEGSTFIITIPFEHGQRDQAPAL